MIVHQSIADLVRPPVSLVLGMLLLLLASATSCTEPEGTVAKTTPRVVSMSAAANAFVARIGAADLLVPHRPDPAGHVSAGEIVALAPDIVLVSDATRTDAAFLRTLIDARIDLVEFAPHDLADLFALTRTLGTRLVGSNRAHAFEHGITRPLAMVSGTSPTSGRPRVAVVTSLDPPTLAGGHSFAADLVEAAGGDMVTHEIDTPRLELTPGAWRRLAPDLVLVFQTTESEDDLRLATLHSLPTLPHGRPRFVRVALDSANVWRADPAASARALRNVIHPGFDEARTE